ncbi:hypothetical protein PFISCL1PPCAC_4938, partial [Pristionchus fissidentatus]
MTCIIIIIIPISAFKLAAWYGFGIGGMKDNLPFSLIYLFYLLLTIFTVTRVKNDIPFSLYLIDLLPLSDRPSYSSKHNNDDNDGDEKAGDKTVEPKPYANGSLMQGHESTKIRKKLHFM